MASIFYFEEMTFCKKYTRRINNKQIMFQRLTKLLMLMSALIVDN